MKWATALSRRDAFPAAAKEATQLLREALGTEPDLVLMFAAGYGDAAPEVVRAALGQPRLVGCSAGGVIGGGQEVEQVTALSLVGATLGPDIGLHPFHLDPVYTPRFANDHDGWRRKIPAPVDETRCMLIFPDPHTADSQLVLAGVDESFPGVTVLGGLASGDAPGRAALYLDDQTFNMGTVGVALSGPLAVETLISQGCRPIGKPLVVTATEENFILEIEKRRALDVLNEIFRALPKDEQKRFARSLVIGLELDKNAMEYRTNELLVRNVHGVDPESGAISVSAYLEAPQVIQFMVRDAHAAEADLAHHLEMRAGGPQPEGALLFSCLGRGRGFFGAPNHDSDLLRQQIGNVPVGGFFSNGEIGPISGKTFIHSYTSAFGLFRRTST